MFINSEELSARSLSPDNLVNSIEHRRLHNGGRREGDINQTAEARAQMAALAQLLPVRLVAEAYDVHTRTVDTYKAGEVTRGTKDPGLISKKAEKEDKIADKAADLLLNTLGGLEQIDLIGSKHDRKKGKDIASIAKSLSDIHFKLSGGLKKSQDPLNSDRAKIVIYAPNMKSLSDYGEVIEATSDNS